MKLNDVLSHVVLCVDFCVSKTMIGLMKERHILEDLTQTVY